MIRFISTSLPLSSKTLMMIWPCSTKYIPSAASPCFMILSPSLNTLRKTINDLLYCIHTLFVLYSWYIHTIFILYLYCIRTVSILYSYISLHLYTIINNIQYYLTIFISISLWLRIFCFKFVKCNINVSNWYKFVISSIIINFLTLYG